MLFGFFLVISFASFCNIQCFFYGGKLFENYESWGRYPKLLPAETVKISWLDQIPDFSKIKDKVLAYGLGRSYGDVCLNEDGTLLNMAGLNRLISIDFENGIIEAEAGLTLADILRIAMPNGWFLSVTPGTKFVTLGGAIANDVHGKNHHVMGTFGNHVLSFELLRSDGSVLNCSRDENYDMFRATIGGLGLTGLITKAKIKLLKTASSFLDVAYIKFDNVDEFFEINQANDKKFDFTVSWVDCTSTDSRLGRGIYSGGNFSTVADKQIKVKKNPPDFPFDYPFINPFTVKIFNILYYNKQIERKVQKKIHYEPFFYPLDAVGHWNRAYGNKGFLQYQFVVPHQNGKEAVKEILRNVAKSGLSSFLTVLKTFGVVESPGMLSFPQPGITMAIDFRMTGDFTLKELDKLDDIVRQNGGRLYPAKDARMRADDFKQFYPEWDNFTAFIDDKFSSSFWRRVNK